MSDSLREQLLQAGFKQTEKAPAKQRHRRSDKVAGARSRPVKKAITTGADHQAPRASEANTRKQAQQVAAQHRKAIKAQIKTLIDASALKEYSGEVAYRYTLQNRIRELHITEPVRQQLMTGSLVITRLNGTTYLVPNTIAEKIRVLNPNWAIVTPADEPSDNADGYDDFPVPDDLVW